MDKTYADVIPDEVAVRRRIEQLKSELRLLHKQRRLSQQCRDEQDARQNPEPSPETKEEVAA